MLLSERLPKIKSLLQISKVDLGHGTANLLWFEQSLPRWGPMFLISVLRRMFLMKRCVFIRFCRSAAIEDHAEQIMSTGVTLEAFSVNTLLFGGIFRIRSCYTKPLWQEGGVNSVWLCSLWSWLFSLVCLIKKMRL